MSGKDVYNDFVRALSENIVRLLQLAEYRTSSSDTTANCIVYALLTMPLSKEMLSMLYRNSLTLKTRGENSKRAVETAANDLKYLLYYKE